MKYILILIIIPTFSFAQIGETEYKKCVTSFYNQLFVKTNISVEEFAKIYSNGSIDYDSLLFISDCMKQGSSKFLCTDQYKNLTHSTSYVLSMIKLKTFNTLTQGYDKEYIFQLINKSSIYNNGLMFSDYLLIRFPNGKEIRFELNKDSPTSILYVWLFDGKLLDDVISDSKTIQYLVEVAMIKDPDGFVNIRDKPTFNSKIIGRLYKNEIFYFTNVSNSEWYPVRKNENTEIIGYIHKSKILRFSDFPKNIKDKVIKERNH